MFLDPAWMQRGVDALREMLDVDGATKRAMIEFLFEEGFWDRNTLRDWQAAEEKFNACLNPSKKVFFKLGEVWALMKRFRRYHLLDAMLEDLGCYPRRERPAEERRLELLERIAANQERLLALINADREELVRLSQAPDPLRIHPGVRAGGSFSQAAPSEEGGF